MQNRSNRKEDGAALALTLIVMVVTTGLIGATFLAVYGDRIISKQLLLKHQASFAADEGLYSLLTHWDTETYNTLKAGDSVTIDAESGNGGATYGGTLIRLGQSTFLAAAEGVSSSGGVRQLSGALFRLQSPRLTPRAAFETRGQLWLGNRVRITGNDAVPIGWYCPETAQPITGLGISSPTDLDPVVSGCAVEDCLSGVPRIVTKTETEPSNILNFDELRIDDLQVVARHILPGGYFRPSPKSENGTCITESRDNWGNPIDRSGPCGDYRPVIVSKGDLTLGGGFGQGVLVVEGNLTLMGGFHYCGLVIVVGGFESLGEGSWIDGAVIAANSNLGEQIVEGATVIRYSSCAVTRAMGGLGRGVLLRERSWLDLY